MPGIRVPIWLSISLTAVGIAASALLWASPKLTLDQKISLVISASACLGGLVAALFVVFAYVQSAWTAVEEQRPQLLIQVVNETHSSPGVASSPTSVTQVRYNNTTGNQFADLSIKLYVQAGNRRIDLADLFHNPMIMPGRDSRVLRFEPLKTSRERGMDLQHEASQGTTVMLHVGYVYTFRSARNDVESQRYKWNPAAQEWVIW
jgi:hypothetical protein